MDGQEIIRRLSPLSLPAGQYCCFGSCTLALLGIREAKDIDVLATPEICDELRGLGWREELVPAGRPQKQTPVLRRLQYPNVDIFRTWDYTGFNRTPTEIIADADESDGIYFAKLGDVIDWKHAFGREKDKVDLKLIERHLKNLQKFVNR